MVDGAIKIEVKGLKELQAAIAKFPKQVEIYMVLAGQESAKRVILPTKGLQEYPPATSANSPPTPYYSRARYAIQEQEHPIKRTPGYAVVRDAPQHVQDRHREQGELR